MSEEKFEYGEEVEMSDYSSFTTYGKLRFFAYQPAHSDPYVGICEDERLIPYRYCRKVRPPFKPGHVIFVRRNSLESWRPRIFDSFTKYGMACCMEHNNKNFTNWEQYSAIPNYDYTKDPVIPE